MPDFSEVEVLSVRRPSLVSFVVRPDEVELALATNGKSLRQRLLLALVAELTTIDAGDTALGFGVRCAEHSDLKTAV